MEDNEYYIYDDRAYVNPTVSRDQQLGFVDTLRGVVDQGNEQITTQTEQLGTNVQPSLGGLTGSEGYFQQRYQTTPIEYQANTLKATAQAKALNDLMSNYAAQAKNRYQQAYRKASKNGGGGGGSGDEPDGLPDNLELDKTEDKTNATVDEADVSLIAPETTDTGVVSAANTIAGVTGQGKLPASSTTPYFYELNGQRTGFWVNRTATGTGVETPMQSFTDKATSREFLQDIIKRGGRIYNQYNKDITGIALYQMGLY